MSDAYLDSVEKADAITRQLCEVYAEYGWFGNLGAPIIHNVQTPITNYPTLDAQNAHRPLLTNTSGVDPLIETDVKKAAEWLKLEALVGGVSTEPRTS